MGLWLCAVFEEISREGQALELDVQVDGCSYLVSVLGTKPTQVLCKSSRYS